MKKGRGISLLSSAVGLLLAAGVMTLFSACGPKADGTLMNCHNAQIGAALCGICLAVLFAIAAFAKKQGGRAGLRRSCAGAFCRHIYDSGRTCAYMSSEQYALSSQA